ncbi:MAG: NADH-quinone oxidoreductase subunit C, partial [Deltaproteobacteria bacterium]|nr:NADH-quinone oxidoreductase subunit C [Deltaproteobacteria bacterium]
SDDCEDSDDCDDCEDSEDSDDCDSEDSEDSDSDSDCEDSEDSDDCDSEDSEDSDSDSDSDSDDSDSEDSDSDSDSGSDSDRPRKTAQLHLARLIQRRMGPGYIRDPQQLALGESAEVQVEFLLDVLQFLKRDPDADLELLVDLSCVDRLRNTPEHPRYAIFYVLRSVRLPYQLSLHVFLDDDTPEIPSVSGLYPAADWLERELYDLFGIYVDSHPHLRRVLLYPGFTSHPMLRDYPAQKTQPLVPLKAPRRSPVVILADGSTQGSDDDRWSKETRGSHS